MYQFKVITLYPWCWKKGQWDIPWKTHLNSHCSLHSMWIHSWILVPQLVTDALNHSPSALTPLELPQTSPHCLLEEIIPLYWGNLGLARADFAKLKWEQQAWEIKMGMCWGMRQWEGGCSQNELRNAKEQHTSHVLPLLLPENCWENCCSMTQPDSSSCTAEMESPGCKQGKHEWGFTFPPFGIHPLSF